MKRRTRVIIAIVGSVVCGAALVAVAVTCPPAIFFAFMATMSIATGLLCWATAPRPCPRPPPPPAEPPLPKAVRPA
jgi:hypothetical protein